MPVLRLNHAVLYVRDAQRSRRLLSKRCSASVGSAWSTVSTGRCSCRPPARPTTTTSDCSPSAKAPGRPSAGRQTVGLYHLAWEVDTLAELERIAGLLSEHGALVGASDHGTTKALYAHDPDGIEFEVSWLVPADLIDEATLAARARIGPLDIETEKRRYGAETRGGVGVSAPA